MVNGAEKTIGIPSDGFCDQHRFVITAFARELLGRDGKKKTKMLPKRHLEVIAAKQLFPQLRRREKFYREQGFTFGKQTTAEKIGLAARSCDDSRGLLILQGAGSDLFKPVPDYILPRRFR